MHINLNKLIRTINKLYRETDLIQFEYTEDNVLRISRGDVTYFAEFDDMKQVLAANTVDSSDENHPYEVLSKYFVNQLSASTGSKAFPEIVSIKSSYI